jgi:peptidoglycan/LPS O-acetylase OafA/YrhL
MAKDKSKLLGSHIAALDGVRGLAIVLVLFVHFIGDETPHTSLERAMTKLANYGVWGVDLFFVLSGFLITGILFDAKGAPNYFKNFYVRRTLRIFPLYYAVLAVLFGILPFLPVPYPVGLAESAHHQAWLWTYCSNIYLAIQKTWALPYIGHFWSLAVEEHFYLLWPFIVWSCGRATLLRVCMGAVVFSLALRIILAYAGAGEIAVLVLTPCRFDALCIGGYLAIAARDGEGGLEKLRLASRPAIVAFGAGVFLVSAWNAATGKLLEIILPLRGSLVALFFGALLIQCITAERTSLLGRFFNNATMRFFGKYSYGLYVFHGVIAFVLVDYATEDILAAKLGSHTVAMIVQAILGAAGSLVVAMASYELFEKHFLRLKDRFASPSRPAPGRAQPIASADPADARIPPAT